MLTFTLNSAYQSSHSDHTFLMYQQTVSDRHGVKGSAIILQPLAPGQPDPKKNIETQSLYIYMLLTWWNWCFLLCPWAGNTSSGISCHKAVIRFCYSTVSPYTLYEGILIFQLLCKGACCIISSRAHVLNLSVSKKTLISSASPLSWSRQQYSQARRL